MTELAHILSTHTNTYVGFPRGATAFPPMQETNRHGFDPWVGKIPWRKSWQLTPVFLPGESSWTEEPGGLQSMQGGKESDTLSD